MDEFIGKKFGRLTVIEALPRERDANGSLKRKMYMCMCDCGRPKCVDKRCLSSGYTASCGCLKVETTRELRRSHDMCNDTLYTLWKHIKSRTTNPNNKDFKHYGARGILMAPEWFNNFSAFYEYITKHLGDKPTPTHSLDRIKNNLGYCAGNLRWASLEDQANNKRSNVLITLHGVTDTLSRQCKRLGLNYGTVRQRRNKLGWSDEKALGTPTRSA